jgi:hypothetical protein
MKYLQVLNTSHSAIFTRDEQPVCILITTASRAEINDMVLTMLGIGHQKSGGQSFLAPFQINNSAQKLVNK